MHVWGFIGAVCVWFFFMGCLSLSRAAEVMGLILHNDASTGPGLPHSVSPQQLLGRARRGERINILPEESLTEMFMFFFIWDTWTQHTGIICKKRKET